MMLKALLWKEWHEQCWRMALACVWLMGATAIGLKTRLVPDAIVVGLIAFAMSFVMPVFAGMGVLAEERTIGTMAFLRAQPVSPWQIILAKAGMGLLVIVVPYTVTYIMVLVTVGTREMSLVFMNRGFFVLVGFSTILYLWQLFIGLKIKRQEIYGVVSAIVIGVWIVMGITVDDMLLNQTLGMWTWYINPFALVELLDAWEVQKETWPVLSQSLIGIGLVGAIVWRFNHMKEARS